MAAGTGLGGYASIKLAHRVPRLVLRIGILIWAVVLTFYAFWVYAAV
jgi:hypothetical protein